LKADQAIVDGEIVALDDAGMPSFQALQHRALHPGHQIVFYAFDLLQLNRRDLTSTPLTKRRSQLAKIVDPDAYLRLLPELPGSAEDVVQAVLEIGLEGVVAKRRDSLYQPGERSADWLKLVLERKQEFVIGGYRLDAPRSIGSLLVGYYEGKQFRFASKVHGGLTPHLRRELLDTLSCRWKPPAVRSPNALDSAQSDRADPIRRLDGGKPAPSCEVHRLAHG